MVLKLLQTQEIEKIVNYKCEREDLNFFHYCRAHSRIGLQDEDSDANNPENPADDLSDSDECAPPPVIKRQRDSPPSEAEQQRNVDAELLSQIPRPPTFPPEVDELGIPTTELPSEPITSYSWRSFFSSINYLRILQKCCKNKAHRTLMLITYKSATHLKKSLKVPQPTLRLYTLKLFKNQVPYCGRKWRQSNMRVITAVYLHVAPNLRDDWLCSSDVDGDVEQAVPLELSLRSLTHWFHVRRWPGVMGVEKGMLREDREFFARELANLGAMDWGEEEYESGADVGGGIGPQMGFDGPGGAGSYIN